MHVFFSLKPTQSACFISKICILLQYNGKYFHSTIFHLWLMSLLPFFLIFCNFRAHFDIMYNENRNNNLNYFYIVLYSFVALFFIFSSFILSCFYIYVLLSSCRGALNVFSWTMKIIKKKFFYLYHTLRFFMLLPCIIESFSDIGAKKTCWF